MTKKPRKKYYIQPEDLRLEIFDFQETGKASERLGEMLIQIATGLAASSKFDQRTYRDDMAGDAVLRMYKNLHLIDTIDPKDLDNSCERDFNRNNTVKYSDDEITDEIRAAVKPPVEFKNCIITKFNKSSTSTCDIAFFKMVTKEQIDENGKIETVEERLITETRTDVPLKNVLFKKINPFSYLTMIAYRVYLGRCDKENKRDRAVDAYREECYSEFEVAECISNRSPNEGEMDMGFDNLTIEPGTDKK